MTARWALALSVATAIMVASSGGEAPPSVCVPAGLPVAPDGVLGEDEGSGVHAKMKKEKFPESSPRSP